MSSKLTDVSGGNRANPSAPADQARSKYQTFKLGVPYALPLAGVRGVAAVTKAGNTIKLP